MLVGKTLADFALGQGENNITALKKVQFVGLLAGSNLLDFLPVQIDSVRQ